MSNASRDVLVAGVGMIPFTKPSAGETYDEMGRNAILLALADAAIPFEKIEQAYAGYVFGDSCCGQRVPQESLGSLHGQPACRRCLEGRRFLF